MKYTWVFATKQSRKWGFGLVLGLFSFPSIAAVNFDLTATVAAQALKTGHFSAAYAGFSQLATSRPGDVTVLRFLAISLDRLGRLQEAQQVFRRALRIAPNSIATQFHLAVSYYKSRNYSLARRYFIRVLSEAKQTPYGRLSRQYLEALDEQLATMQRPGAPAQWGLYLQLAYQRDNNIPAAPASPVLYKGQRKGSRSNEYLAVDYHFLQRPDWTATAGVASYGSQYPDNTFKDYGVRQLSSSLSAQKSFTLGTIKSRAELRYEHASVDLNQQPYSTSNTTTLGARLRLSQRIATHLFYRYTRDDFKQEGGQPALTSRDANNQVGGLATTWYFADQRANLKLTLETERNKAHGSNFNFHANRTSLAVNLPLPWAWQLRLTAAYNREFYGDFIGPIARNSRRMDYSLALSRWFGNHMLIQINLQSRDENSSYESLTYDRLLWGTSFSYVY